MSVVAFSKPMDDGADGISVTTSSLDALLPLHVQVNAQGKITHTGPTFAKLLDADKIMDVPVFELLTVKRPADIANVAKVLAHQGEAMSIQLKEMPGQNMKAVAASMPGGGFILNLSLGAGVMDRGCCQRP